MFKNKNIFIISLALILFPFRPVGAATTTIDYSYDDLNRLKSVTRSIGTSEYTYDEVGNIINKRIAAVDPLRLDVTPVNPNIVINNTLQLTATASFGDGSTTDVSSVALWNSSNPSIASVDTRGLLTGAALGSTTVTARFKNITSPPITVTVTNDLLEIKVTTPKPWMILGLSSQQFTAKAVYQSGSEQDITLTAEWQSSNPAIAAVNSQGLVTALSQGETKITASLYSRTSADFILPIITQEGDADLDGLSNYQEYLLGMDPLSIDTDKDGMNDAWEVNNGLNPLVDDAAQDLDGDGYSNLAEYYCGTNPHDGGSFGTCQMIPGASDIRVDTNAPGSTDSYYPQIASDGDGHVYVTWTDYRNNSGDIYFNYSTDYGKTWQASDIRLDTDAPGAHYSEFPYMVTDGQGNIYVAWGEWGRDNGLLDIYFNFSNDHGATWQTSDIRVNSGPGTSWKSDQKISADGNGHVYAVWIDDRNQFGVYDIYLNYSNDYGKTWQPNDIRIEKDTPGAAASYGCQINSDSRGHVYVTWYDLRNGSRDIFFNYSNDYGVTWQTNDIRLDTNGAGSADSYFPKMTTDNNGHIYVLWYDYRNGAGADIYFNSSADYGVTWRTSDIRLDTDSPGVSMSWYPYIASDDIGHVYAIWSDERNGFYDIYYNYSSNYGSSWQANDIQIDSNPLGVYSYDRRIATDKKGHVYVSWTDHRNGGYDVFYDFSNNHGKTWQSTDIRLNTNSPGSTFSFASEITTDGKGHVYVTWSDFRNGSSDVFMNSVKHINLDQPVSIDVTPAVSSLILGQTQQFRAVGNYADGPSADITNLATWQSSNPSAVSINSAGLATGLAVGGTQITAVLSGRSSNAAQLSVTNDLLLINISPVNPTLALGKTQQFTAQGTYQDSSVVNITNTVNWNSTNPSVAAINSTGLAQVLGKGTTNITASLNNLTSPVSTLTAVNTAPVLNPIGNRTVDEGVLLQFTVQGSDIDGQNLIYTASNLPEGASFNPGTRIFSWTPNYRQGGTYTQVHFEISDGFEFDFEDITITVNNLNQAPVLAPIGQKSVDENSTLDFKITATDPESDPLFYSALNLPQGAAFDPLTQQFSWTPTFDQAGIYGTIVNTNFWHHLEFKRSAENLDILLDGVHQDLTKLDPSAQDMSASTDFEDLINNLAIGSTVGGGYPTGHQFLDGWVDEFKVNIPGKENDNLAYKLLIPADGVDGSQIFTDATGNHPITAVGNAQIDTAEKVMGTGSALFDGDGDYLTMPDSEDWNFGTGDFTIDFWIYFNSLTPDQDIYRQYVDENNFVRIYFDTPRSIGFSAKTNGVYQVNVQTGYEVFPLEKWNHIEVVRNGTSLFIFVNDASQGLTVFDAIGTNSLPNLSADLCIGRNEVVVPPTYFDGWIDELTIKKYVDPDLKLLIPADGQDGSQNFTDATGNHPITAVGNAQIDTAEKKVGTGSALFDGDGDYLTVPDNSDWNFGTEDFTIDFWVNFNSLSNQYNSFASQNDGVSASWSFRYDSVLKILQFTVSVPAVELLNFTTPWVSPTLNTWYHLALIRNGNVFTIYRDGVALDSQPAAITMPDVGAVLKIGQWGNYPSFNGWIDEFKIKKIPPAVDPNLKLHIPADGQDGSQIFTDAAGNYPITAQGNAQIDTGEKKIGTGSALLDGSGDYLTIPDSEDWHFGTGDFTLDFWVRLNSKNKNQTLVSQVDAFNPGHLLQIGINNENRIFFYFKSASTYISYGTNPPVHFEVTDSEKIDSEDITIVVNNVNQAPILNPIGAKSVDENQTLTFTVSASDPDGDPLTYSASVLPPGATFDPATRIFSWTPTYDQAGAYPNIHFEVRDNKDFVFENITITVNNVNQVPNLVPIGDKSVAENGTLTFTVMGNDPDVRDILSYSASNLPTGAVFDPQTQTFAWTPSYDQAGTYPNVHFEVTDGGDIDSEDITITVNNVNRAPILNQIGAKSVDENATLTFTVSASDLDAGEILIYSATNLPQGAAFDPQTQVFTWTPDYDQAGTYPNVHFEVTDDDKIASEDITITVNNVNRAPILNPIGAKSVDENTTLTFTVTANDPDAGTNLVYSASNLPVGATFNPQTQTFAWTPSYDQAGTYPNVHFEVTDGNDIASEDITITVNNINRTPVLDPIGPKSVDENAALTFTVTAADPDLGSNLVYSASNLPSGASFDPLTQQFTWTPSYEQAGTYPQVHFEVSDGSVFDAEDITITVNNINRTPVLDPIGPKSVDENITLTFTVTGSDSDAGTNLVYSASNLPVGATFNPQTQTFAWTPSYDQAGTYPNVHFEVTDGGDIDSEDITITVGNIIAPPTVSIGLNTFTIPAGSPFVVTIDGAAESTLSSVWWAVVDKNNPSWHDISGSIDGVSRDLMAGWTFGECGGETNCHYTNTVTINQPGTYEIRSNARDVLYPLPGKAHQTSEGAGLQTKEITVVP